MASDSERPAERGGVELPAPTAAPLVLGLGLTLLAAGVVLSLPFSIVGAGLCLAGLWQWTRELFPGRGHTHEPLQPPPQRPAVAAPGAVEILREGMPGYRLRLPIAIHPISAGIRGGIVGGLVMPIPALLYGVISGRGFWFPVNLLAGIVLPGVDEMTAAQLGEFNAPALLVAVLVHALLSLGVGTIYGVLLPTLPAVPNPLAWGGLLMPLLWTAVSFGLMGTVNPVLAEGVDWPWFIASQFIFGMAAALLVMRVGAGAPLRAGLLGGAAGGILMALPALLWGLASGRGVWYPVNLLAAMVVPGLDEVPAPELGRFRADWLAAGLGLHAALSLGIGVTYALALPRLPTLPGQMAWGALALPLVWTGFSYGAMGVVNPTLREYVNWFWFVLSQLCYGLAAAIVVARSEKVPVPPAGREP